MKMTNTQMFRCILSQKELDSFKNKLFKEHKLNILWQVLPKSINQSRNYFYLSSSITFIAASSMFLVPNESIMMIASQTIGIIGLLSTIHLAGSIINYIYLLQEASNQPFE